ncbi:MAG TPA: hypothetical protein VG498_09985, partial [Terriglobales bacterium]|nr:hypothetical protein [Terriglobales bacterium]
MSNGKTAGSEVDAYGPNGRVDCTFEFNDRGRGPKIAAHYVLGADGLPQRTDVTGNDYLKAPVDEHFVIENGAARWNSTSETGQTRSLGFYISNNGPIAESAFLARALLKSNSAPLKLLPAGEAQIEKMTDVTLENQGQKVHVTEFGITGLGYEPQTLWLDDDQHLFAVPGNWFAILREGWERTNDRLFALDRAAEDARHARLAKELAQRPEHPVAVEHVRLFDSEQATMRDDQTVVIKADRIFSVGPSDTASVPSDALRIDGRGKTLLPGLFDMHAHLQATDGLLDVASGVTGARDMGNDIEQLRHLQDQWDSGTAIGPRVWKSGFIDGRGP